MAPTSPPTSRSWSSLVTERWHRSSRVVLWLVLVALLLCNVPGQFVRDIHYELGYPFYLVEHWVHGWPGTYLTREAVVHHADILAISPSAVYFYNPTLTDCFSLGKDLEQTRWWMLALNVCCVVLASFVAGLVFESWRRQRTTLWQIHLRDCLVASLVVSCVAAGCMHKYRLRKVEERLQLQDNEDGFPPLTVDRQDRLTWLRICFSKSSWLQVFDSPLTLKIWDQRGWSSLHHFPEARLVEIHVPASTEDLAHLSALPNLEAISFNIDLDMEWSDKPAELPPLPHLRGLMVGIPARLCRRLDRLTDLTSIRITDVNVDDQALKEISQLRNLRHLSLNGLEPSADLSFLPKLTHLTRADFYHSEVDDDALQNIGQCSGLQELSLYMCEVDDRCIPHLAKLTRLRDLDLLYTDVKEIERLQQALPDCNIQHRPR